MAERGFRKQRPIPGDRHNPDSITSWVLIYLEAIQVRGYSPHTVNNRFVALEIFITWCEERSLIEPGQITRPILQRYQRWLFHYRRKNGRPLSFSTQSSRLASVRMFFKWLTRENILLSNPASEIDMPRVKRAAPRQVLTSQEVETILALPDIEEPLGLRDRAILETLYSTGMRRQELLNLRLFDVDSTRGTVFIHSGKGNKDRTVPIGERALAWCEKYLKDARPQLIYGKDEGHFFVNREGQSLLASRLSQMVRNFVRAADIGKDGSCHLFRHTAATVLLEGGADLRSIQEILGHSKLETTEIYTKVSIRRLKRVHEESHPAAMISRKRKENDER